MKKPKDCICGFPNHHTINMHGHWCPSYKRLEKRRENLYAKNDWQYYFSCKDAWGRYYTEEPKNKEK